MKRCWWGTLVAAAIACALPSLARAAQPDLGGQVTGMSGLPDRVQDAVAREARRTNSAIGELRVASPGRYRAALDKDGHGEVVTFDRAGKLVERQDY